MRYSTGPKKNSRLQGQRKRRRVPIVFKAAEDYLDTMVLAGLMTQTQYKTMRQYFNDFNRQENGYSWLTEDLDPAIKGGNKRDAAAETGFEFSGDSFRHHRPGHVLIREPESCRECGNVFLALYVLRSCIDHEGLDQEDICPITVK